MESRVVDRRSRPCGLGGGVAAECQVGGRSVRVLMHFSFHLLSSYRNVGWRCYCCKPLLWVIYFFVPSLTHVSHDDALLEVPQFPCSVFTASSAHALEDTARHCQQLERLFDRTLFSFLGLGFRARV